MGGKMIRGPIDGKYVELWGIPAWRRKLGIGGDTLTLQQRIEQLIEANETTSTIDKANARLAAFATLEEAGYIVQTSTDPPTFAGRQILGTTNQITVTYGTGIPGNTRLTLPQDIHDGAIPKFQSITPTLLTAEFVTYVNATGQLASTTVTAAELEGAAEMDVLTTRGDLLSHDGATYIRVPVGAANTVTRTDGLDVLWGKVVLTTDVTGVLPVANGGTNASSWTAGSVIFAGAGGTSLAQDNANLFYDDALNRFGVGTASPLTTVQFVGSGFNTLDVVNTNVTGSPAIMASRDATGQPTSWVGLDEAGRVSYWNANGLEFRSYTAWSANYQPGGSALRMFINASGNVAVGVAVPLSRLHVAIDDAVATVTDVLRLNHSLSTGGTAANFGTGILLTGETSTTDARDMARIQAIWTDATDATRTSALQFQTVNSAGALATVATLTGAGNFGVNVTNPTARIMAQVAATQTDLFQFNASSGSFRFVCDLNAVGTGAARLRMRDSLNVERINLHTAGSTYFNVPGQNFGIGNGAPGALLDLGLAGTTLGVMRMAGSTSGNVTIQPAAIAGTWTLTLPVNDGGSGDVLTTDGGGITSWTAPTAVGHNMLSATHTDSVVNAVTRGSLIYGNATPAWDELNVGSANRILWTDGTDVSWTDANLQWVQASNSLRIGNPSSVNSTIVATTATARTTTTYCYLLEALDTSATNTIFKIGLYVPATGSWSGTTTSVTAIFGFANGSSVANIGGEFEVEGSANNSYGVIGRGDATGTNNIGVYGVAQSAATTNYGGYFDASGAVTNYGVYIANSGLYINNGGIYVNTGTTRIAPSTTTVAPLLFASGTVLTTPAAGVMEYNGRFHLTDVDATRRHIVQAANDTKVTAGAPYANDGYVEMVINGTTLRVMTTA